MISNLIEKDKKDKKDNPNITDNKDKHNNKDKKDTLTEATLSQNLEKNASAGSMSFVRNVFFVRDVMDKEGLAGKIQLILYENGEQTLKQLNEKLGIDVDSLRTTISRAKDLIKLSGKEKKEIIYSLTNLAISKIETIIEQHKKQILAEKLKEEKQKEEQKVNQVMCTP
ncbi:MAG: hypothetical protein AABX54_01245 [Nanoarchaeota archaeon]